MSHRFFAALIQPQYAETVSLAETLGEARRKCPILGGLPKRRRNSPLVPTDHFHGYPRRMKTACRPQAVKTGGDPPPGKKGGPVMASKLSISKERTAELIKEFGKNDQDSGSAEVQVAILSERIRNLTEHLKTHKKDNHTRRGLMMLIGKRRGMLKYIKERNIEEYRELIKKLGIRDNI